MLSWEQTYHFAVFDCLFVIVLFSGIFCIKLYINRDDSNANRLKHIYLFVFTSKPALELLKQSHDSLTVPEEYAAIDSRIMNVIDTLINVRDAYVSYIETNKTLEGFDYKTAYKPLSEIYLRSNINLLTLIVDLK